MTSGLRISYQGGSFDCHGDDMMLFDQEYTELFENFVPIMPYNESVVRRPDDAALVSTITLLIHTSTG